MDSSSDRSPTSVRYFGRGKVADVILWKQKDTTLAILLGTLSAWVVFELSGYTLMSLVGRVLLLLISILFVWAKAAGVLNRPPPPIPRLHLSEEVIVEAARSFCSHFNTFFSSAYDVALGKDSELFFKASTCLLLISVVGSFADFLTIGYTSVVLVLTLPVLYEKYEHPICSRGLLAYMATKQALVRVDNDFCKLRKRIWVKMLKMKMS